MKRCPHCDPANCACEQQWFVDGPSPLEAVELDDLKAAWPHMAPETLAPAAALLAAVKKRIQ